MPERDGIKGIPKSQEKAGVKPNPGKVDDLPMDHWAFGVFDRHTQNNNV